jgi:NADPH-dependent glutamate synthase beta subunit-like oxidoreductase
MDRLNLLQSLSDNITIDHNKCIYCGLCVERCILDNLRMKLAPCRQACPLGVNAQGYVKLIARGEEDKAREQVLKDLPFPGILGRVCDNPCEDSCHRKSVTGEAVAIRALKRYLFPGTESLPIPEKAEPTGRSVGVVGSGPAGMTAAFDLAVKGHGVVVFEAAEKPGGMLDRVIPEFRLPRDTVVGEIGVLESLGVEFRCGVEVGENPSFADLEAGFDAVVLAAGLGGSKEVGIEGEALPGVNQAMPVLESVRHGKGPAFHGHVVVIGGGNAAVDSAQTALRLGAELVTVVSLESRSELPAFENEILQAASEGVVFDCAWGPVRIIGKSGRVSGIELRRCVSVFDESGCFNPCFDDRQSRVLPCDHVITAIGQAGDMLDMLPVELRSADPVTLQTAREKVFLAGDCFSGPSSVVRAMASGRRAAESVDRLLNGDSLSYNREYKGPVVTDFDIDISRAADRPRVCPSVHRLEGSGDFKELEGTLTLDEARAEAERCYSCGTPFGMYRNCWFCLPCEVSCPEEALWVEIPYLLR